MPQNARKVAKIEFYMNEYKKILEKTNSGLDIFCYYLGRGCLKKKFRSPFRTDDCRPSCHLYLNEPKGEQSYYYLQDFGDSRCSGNAVAIAARILGMSAASNFKAVLERIDQDLCLGVFEQNKGKYSSKPQIDRAAIQQEMSKGRTSSIKSFEYVIQDFPPKEAEYWGRYGIDSKTLLRYNVHSLRSVTFTKTDGKSFNIFSSNAIPAYGYFFNQMEGIKVYRPQAANRFLYGGSLPSPYVFGWEQLPPKGSQVFITGGEKDVLSLAAHGFHAIAFNSETAKIPPDKMEQLSERFERIIFLYDSDATGIKESKLRVEEFKESYNVARLELPLSGTKQEKDISDYFALGKSAHDLQELIYGM